MCSRSAKRSEPLMAWPLQWSVIWNTEELSIRWPGMTQTSLQYCSISILFSFSRLLTLYNVHLRYVSPSNLGMPNEVMDYIGSKGIPQVKQQWNIFIYIFSLVGSASFFSVYIVTDQFQFARGCFTGNGCVVYDSHPTRTLCHTRGIR